MKSNHDTRLIGRLIGRLEHLQENLLRETSEVVDQYSFHHPQLCKELGGLTETLSQLEGDFSREAGELRNQLKELEVQLARIRMDATETYQEQSEAIRTKLEALETTITRIADVEEEKGVPHLKNFVAEARKLEDQLAALHIHFSLKKSHAPEAVRHERELLGQRSKELAAELQAAIHDQDIPQRFRRILHNAPKLIHEALAGSIRAAGVFLHYEETEEERRAKEKLADLNID